MKALDRARPFGRVYGTTDGRFYEQDDRFFRVDGSPWEPSARADTEPPGEGQQQLPAAAKAPRKAAKTRVTL